MGLPAGCEVVAHSVRYLLEADTTLVVGKVNYQMRSMQLTRNLSWMLFPMKLLFFYPSPNSSYAGPLQGLSFTIGGNFHWIYSAPWGVPRRESQLNMGQAPSIRRATDLHPDVFIFFIADDNHVVGKPEHVVPAILTIRHLYSQIGLSLAATTQHKNVIYGTGTTSPQSSMLLLLLQNCTGSLPTLAFK